MTTSPARSARYPALRHRNFTLIWSGLLVSNMGTWMQNVAQSWLIYKLTGNDPWYLGLLGLSFAVPMVVVPPLGGWSSIASIASACSISPRPAPCCWQPCCRS